jgi:protein-S-isoprenylcysteine O-methyltransferase Ste14
MALFHSDIWKHQLRATLYYWGMLPALVLGPGLLLDWLLNLRPLQFSGLLKSAVVVFVGVGVLFVTCSTRDLQKYGDGTPSPLRPAKRLIMDGSYHLCRHPMFFGYDLILLAAVLTSRSLAALIISYPAFLFWSILVLRKEEQLLARRFKDTYQQYQRQVPFLIPRLKRSQP